MKQEYHVIETIQLPNPLANAMMIDALNRKLKKRNRKTGIIYSVSLKDNKIIIDLICDEKTAFQEKKDFEKERKSFAARTSKMTVELKKI